jgi:hypothetical protein
MKKITLLFSIIVLFGIFGFKTNSYAQNGPVLYFCEKYDVSDGEVGISDRFTTGYLTVMIKCDYALGLKSVSVQFDKYNCITDKFDYYNKFEYTVKPDMKYIYFAGTGDKLNFKDPGLYRVYLLDENNKTVTSSLIEIIR